MLYLSRKNKKEDVNCKMKKISRILRDPTRAERLIFGVVKACFLCSLAIFTYLLLLVSDIGTYGYFSIREMMSSIAEYGAAALMLAVGGICLFDLTLKKLG